MADCTGDLPAPERREDDVGRLDPVRCLRSALSDVAISATAGLNL
jgi:hypothetical protein